MKIIISLIIFFFSFSLASSQQDTCWMLVHPHNPNNGYLNPDSVMYDTCLCVDKPWNKPISKFQYAKKWFSVILPYGALIIPKSKSDTIIYKSWVDIDTNFVNLRNGFEEMERKFGNFILRKNFPFDIDSTIDGSRSFNLKFDNYVNIDTVINYLFSIVEIEHPTYNCLYGKYLSNLSDSIFIYGNAGNAKIRLMTTIRQFEYHKRGGAYNFYSMNIPMAWEITKGNENITIGVMDDFYGFTDDNGRYWYNKKEVSDEEYNTNNLEPGHGVGLGLYQQNEIYLGTEKGIYKATNTTNQGWLWNLNDHYLNNIKINYLSIQDKPGISFACTDNSIYKSTNNGVEWNLITDLSGKIIHCIILVGDNYFVGTNNGIYKSSNDGDNWGLCSQSSGWNVNTLFYFNYNNLNTFFAGTIADNYGICNGLQQSIDNGSNWSMLPGSQGPSPNADPWNIQSVLINNNIIYIGTVKHGLIYLNNGSNWVTNNSGLPVGDYNDYYTINSIAVINRDNIYYLLIGTENGLFKREVSSYNWNYTPVREGSMDIFDEKKIKMLYINGNELWVVCHGGEIFPGSTFVNEPSPSNPENWGNFNCHEYAWHFTEGGISGISDMFDSPEDLGYIKHPDEESAVNWDYIKANNDDIINGNWDKVTYGNIDYPHSGVKSNFSSYPNDIPFDEKKIKIISKWNKDGPLVEHYLESNPYGDRDKKFWKSKKKISNVINESQDFFIGRQIEADAVISNQNNPTVNFYVAPMYNHYINLKSNFHTENGSNFHAYIYDNCFEGGKWEEYTHGLLNSKSDGANISSLLKNRVNNPSSIILKVYPNPSNIYLNIYSKITDYDKLYPISIKIYKINGQLVKNLTAKNGVEFKMDIKEINSGTYLITAECAIVNDENIKSSFSEAEIITIEK